MVLSLPVSTSHPERALHLSYGSSLQLFLELKKRGHLSKMEDKPNRLSSGQHGLRQESLLFSERGKNSLVYPHIGVEYSLQGMS